MTGRRDLAALPKAHLHIHLEGAMRPSTLKQLSEEDGHVVPPVRNFTGFTAFVGQYMAACDVLTTEARLRRIVREVVEDAATDGVTWIEPAFYAPRYAAQFSTEGAVEIVLDELQQEGQKMGVGSGLIVAADRTVDPGEAMTLARIAAAMAGRGVIGFGLANDEAGHPPEPFGPAFAVAKDAGLLSVPHGGELAGPESVIGCLDACNADRIMHGVRAVEDPELLRRLADEGTCLDVCPSSNVALSVVSRIEDHPLPVLLEAGIRCSLNADDPLLFGPGVLDEYELCRNQLSFDDATLARIATWSLESSGAPSDVLNRGLDGIQRWMET